MSYVYIGQYYHKFDELAPVPNEKKIGISVDVPKRESSLNSTNLTIGYATVKYWNVGEAYKRVEAGIHALLNDVRMANATQSTEFFRDSDDTLVSRVSQFMRAMGYSEVLPETTGASKEEKRVIEEARVEGIIRDQALLVGETFYTNRCNATISVECDINQYTAYVDGVQLGVFNTLSKAFQRGISHANDTKCGGQQTTTINVWVTKNANGQTPDDVCKAKQLCS